MRKDKSTLSLTKMCGDMGMRYDNAYEVYTYQESLHDVPSITSHLGCKLVWRLS